MSNGGSRLMAPMTALRMVDMHNSAARLLPKPMPPNVAKRARMNIRRQKRAITWIDLSCRGRFGICAKFQNPDGCALRGPRHRRDAGPARRRGNALGFYERAQNRQR